MTWPVRFRRPAPFPVGIEKGQRQTGGWQPKEKAGLTRPVHAIFGQLLGLRNLRRSRLCGCRRLLQLPELVEHAALPAADWCASRCAARRWCTDRRAVNDRALGPALPRHDREHEARKEKSGSQKRCGARERIGLPAPGHEPLHPAAAHAKSAAFGALQEDQNDERDHDHQVNNDEDGVHMDSGERANRAGDWAAVAGEITARDGFCKETGAIGTVALHIGGFRPKLASYIEDGFMRRIVAALLLAGAASLPPSPFVWIAVAQTRSAYEAGLHLAHRRHVANPHCYARVFEAYAVLNRHARWRWPSAGRRTHRVQHVYQQELFQRCGLA